MVFNFSEAVAIKAVLRGGFSLDVSTDSALLLLYVFMALFSTPPPVVSAGAV